jgi:hypothetical protein
VPFFNTLVPLPPPVNRPTTKWHQFVPDTFGWPGDPPQLAI